MKDENQDQAGREGGLAALSVEANQEQEERRSLPDPEELVADAAWLLRDYWKDLRTHREAIAASDWEALDPTPPFPPVATCGAMARLGSGGIG